MAYKRILTIQDISCVGQCSMTVALPILSVCGHETCILPTAVLSTHTGGFGKPEVIHLTDKLEDFWKHWQENAIAFDCILVGYLGSERAVDAVCEIAEHMLISDGILIVDPALADHGKRYSGLSEDYSRKMWQLCRKADIIMPNVTEAALFSGVEYRENVDEAYVRLLLEKLAHPCVVLTGVGYEPGQTGAVLYENGTVTHIVHSRIEKSFHGTGDMFAASFTGALLQGISKEQAVRIAGDFVYTSIEKTVQNPAHWYGVKFETAFSKLLEMLHEEKPMD